MVISDDNKTTLNLFMKTGVVQVGYYLYTEGPTRRALTYLCDKVASVERAYFGARFSLPAFFCARKNFGFHLG